jgi:hypothetical protein
VVVLAPDGDEGIQRNGVLVDDSYNKGFELLIGSTQIWYGLLGDNIDTKQAYWTMCNGRIQLGIRTSLVGDSMFENCSPVEDLGVYSKLQSLTHKKPCIGFNGNAYIQNVTENG